MNQAPPSTRLPHFGLGTFKLYKEHIESILPHALSRHSAQNHYLLPDEYLNKHSDMPRELCIDSADIYANQGHIGEVLERYVQLDGEIAEMDHKYDESGHENAQQEESQQGDSHEELKQQEKLPRSEIFLVSKIPPRHMRNPKENVRKVVLTALEQFRVAYIDLYLVHWPARDKKPPNDPIHRKVREETWIELEKLHKEGKILMLGVSNYEVRHLKEMKEYATVMPVTNQFEVHPHLQQRELRDYCIKEGIDIMAYSPLGSADGVKRILGNETIVKIAEQLKRTPSQVVLRWHLQLGHIIIPRTSSVEHLEENRAIFDFELTDEQMEAINGINIEERYCWDPTMVI